MFGAEVRQASYYCNLETEDPKLVTFYSHLIMRDKIGRRFIKEYHDNDA